MEKEFIKDVEIDKVKENPENPRVNQKAVSYVKKSILESGYISPIITDENFIILAGHTRLKALKEMGYKKIPHLIKISGLTNEQKKKFLIQDNKSTEFAEWELGKLRNMFSNLELEDLGFNIAEIDQIIKKTEIKDVVFDVPTGRDFILIVCDSREDFIFLTEKLGLKQAKELTKKSIVQARAIKSDKVIELLK